MSVAVPSERELIGWLGAFADAVPHLVPSTLRDRRRATCLFIVAPLVFRNATGSPVNPLAVV